MFTAKYILTGKDKDAVRKLFTDEILNYCEQNHVNSVCIKGNGDTLIFYRYKKTIPSELKEVTAFIEEGTNVFKLFKKKHDTVNS